MERNIPDSRQKRVVILGAGFAGLNLALALRDSDLQVVILDRKNYYMHTPLIYHVAAFGIEPSAISYPYHLKLRGEDNIHFRMAEVTAVDTKERKVSTSLGEIGYDYLVVATGSTSLFFGMEDVEKAALPLKSMHEAIEIRNRILENLELSLYDNDPALRNIVIAGAGPSGMQLAAVLAGSLNRDERATRVKIYLVDAVDRLLGNMPQKQSDYAVNTLKKKGVEVLLNHAVTGYTDGKVTFKEGDPIATRAFIWTSGIGGRKLAGLPDESYGKGNKLLVDGDGSVIGVERVFAAGDISFNSSNPAPPNSLAAMQQGRFLARNLVRLAEGKRTVPFRYRDPGSVINLGSRHGILATPHCHTHGILAWWCYIRRHSSHVIGCRNKRKTALSMLFPNRLLGVNIK